MAKTKISSRRKTRSRRRRKMTGGGGDNATCSLNDSSIFCPSCPSSSGSGSKPSGTTSAAYAVGSSGTGATVPPSWLQQMGNWWNGETAIFTTARSNPVASNLQLNCPNGSCLPKSTSSSGNLSNPNISVDDIMGEGSSNPPLNGDLNLTGTKGENTPIYRMRAGSRKRKNYRRTHRTHRTSKNRKR